MSRFRVQSVAAFLAAGPPVGSAEQATTLQQEQRQRQARYREHRIQVDDWQTRRASMRRVQRLGDELHLLDEMTQQSSAQAACEKEFRKLLLDDL